MHAATSNNIHIPTIVIHLKQYKKIKQSASSMLHSLPLTLTYTAALSVKLLAFVALQLYNPRSSIVASSIINNALGTPPCGLSITRP
jgi:hypothetical protein